MQITKLPNQYQIKTKAAQISLDDKIQINDVVLDGPGEYEVADVQAQGEKVGTFIFQSEDIKIGYLNHINKPLTDEELEKVDDVDVLLVPVGEGNLSFSEATKIVNQIEPKIVIPIFCSDPEAFVKQAGWPSQIVEVLKISSSTLPSGETKAVVVK